MAATLMKCVKNILPRFSTKSLICDNLKGKCFELRYKPTNSTQYRSVHQNDHSTESLTDAVTSQTDLSLVSNSFSSEFNEKMVGRTKFEQHKLFLLTPDSPPNAKMLHVAIIGAPNVGKSTLTNSLMGWRVSSVSKKVHTTRHKTLAVFTENDTQVAFLDTPGVVPVHSKRRHHLEKSLVRDPFEVLEQADIIAVIVDVSNQWTRTGLNKLILKALHLYPDKKSIIILNKVDALKRKDILLTITRQLTEGMVGGVQANEMYTKQKTSTTKKYEKLLRKLISKTEPVVKSSSEMTEDSLPNILESAYNINKSGNTSFPTKSVSQTGTHLDSHSGDHPELNAVNKISEQAAADISHADNKFTNSTNSSEKCVNSNSADDMQTMLPRDSNFQTCSESSSHSPENESWTDVASKIRQINRIIQDKDGWDKFDAVFMVSAINGDGIHTLKNYFLNHAKPGQWDYHSSLVTDQDPIEIAKMCIWEKLLENLPKEIPYNMDVDVSMWDISEDGLLQIVVTLWCRNKRYMVHTLGPQGRIISKISAEAKQEIMNTFRCDVKLKLVAKIIDRK